MPIVTQTSLEILGHRTAIAECGDGPAVLMLHGFPGLSYSYRHQLVALAEAGYRAIAPDMLGYGGTDAPQSIASYAYDHVTDWLVALLDALGVEKAVVVGHDFGASSAWNLALRARERVSGLVSLSVPYDPDRSATRPSELYAAMAKKHFLHIHYFQEPGVAERELDGRAREFLARLFHALSGDFRYLDIWGKPSAGNGYLDVLPAAPPLPWSWLDEADLDHYASVFASTGFRGGLSWYRAFDANWELGDAYVGARLEVPTMLVAGANDAVIQMRGPKAIARMREFVSDLRGIHLLPGAGHWIQQERRDDVNRLLIEFVRGLGGT